MDYRKYPYSPSINGVNMGISNSSSINSRGQKINRYYKKLKPYYVKQTEDDYTLIFESRFESGNLRRAIQVNQFEYDLILKYDYQTTNYT